MTDEITRGTGFRFHAREVRIIAAGIEDQECRENLLGLAEDYDRIAELIELAVLREGSRNTTLH